MLLNYYAGQYSYLMIKSELPGAGTTLPELWFGSAHQKVKFLMPTVKLWNFYLMSRYSKRNMRNGEQIMKNGDDNQKIKQV